MNKLAYSVERVNYSIRPNKNVERKLIADCFAGLDSEFSIRDYRYIGFGGLWFVDFILFHKRLFIDQMYSIEKGDLSKRAAFNSPLKCIKVVSGESTTVLPDLPLNDKTLLWLDYDSDLRGPWKQDLEIVLSRAANGMIVVVTLNSHHKQLNRMVGAADKELNLVDAFEQLVGELKPLGIENKHLKAETFPSLVSQVLISQCKRRTRRSDPDLAFEVLFNFHYQDGAPMVTIGGIVLNGESRRRLEKTPVRRMDFLTGEKPYSINVPNLTLKEKREIDRLLPKKTAPLRKKEVEARLRFEIDESHVENYEKFYKYYPLFVELQE